MRDPGTPLFAAVAFASLLGTAWAQEPTPAPEPTPSSEQTASVQPAKDKSGFLKRKARLLFSDAEPKGAGPHWGPFYPSIADPSTGSGPGPLLHFWLPDIGGSTFDVHASAIYSIYQYQCYDFQVGWLPHRGRRPHAFATGSDSLYPLGDLYETAGMKRFNLYASLRHRRYPRESFYGLGPATLESDRSDYTLRDTLFEVVSEFRPASWLTLSARGGLLRTSIRSGEDKDHPDAQTLFTDASAPALFQQPDYLHASIGLLIDTRDERGNPHRGGTLAVAASRYDDRGGREFQFNRLAADGRRFVRLGSNRHVLALRAVLSMDQTDPGSRVPFYLQSGLGGSHILRGFGSHRFRGTHLMAYSGEYHFEVVPKVEVALFYDAGKVFEDRKNLDFRGLETSWGAGVRLKSVKKVRIRLDVASSREHIRVHLKFSPSF